MMLDGMKRMLRMIIRERFYRKIVEFRSGMTTIYPVELNLLPTDRCLLLSPHADDESIACGGMICRYPDNFEILCLTNGWSILSEEQREETITVREREFLQAMNCAGVASHGYIHDIDTDTLIDHYADFRRLMDKMDLGSFDYVFIPSLFDQHPDHKAVGRHLAQYAAERNLPSPCRIVLYELWSTLPVPDRYVDISA
ncbi:MAG TPA: PIG-L family deacetylase, partial [Saprospiraceae bacterium]|nr:PIG-L family deacetylase [Saprospiraceae bacterium]